MARFFGTPDDVRVGQFFIDRRELHEAHVHRPLQAGISGTAAEGADSIVVSGGYVDDADHGSYILYTGHGGKAPNSRKQIADQSPSAPGNAGLITSLIHGLPVRVIRGRHEGSPFAPPRGYIYSGLYLVTGWNMRVGKDGYQIIQFRLEAIEGQTQIEPAPQVAADPAFAETTISRRIRDSQLAREIKQLYEFTCQVCRGTVPTFRALGYSEGAHVRPLGRPHLGADARPNLLSLCPNHHTQLDMGGMIIRDDMVAVSTAGLTPIAELVFLKRHRLEVANAQYHRELWTASA